VVEDECDVRSYLVETLKDLNYRVREAANGAAALALFDSNPFRDRSAADRHRDAGPERSRLADQCIIANPA